MKDPLRSQAHLRHEQFHYKVSKKLVLKWRDEGVPYLSKLDYRDCGSAPSWPTGRPCPQLTALFFVFVDRTWMSSAPLACEWTFLFFFVGWRILNLMAGLSGWRASNESRMTQATVLGYCQPMDIPRWSKRTKGSPKGSLVAKGEPTKLRILAFFRLSGWQKRKTEKTRSPKIPRFLQREILAGVDTLHEASSKATRLFLIK